MGTKIKRVRPYLFRLVKPKRILRPLRFSSFLFTLSINDFTSGSFLSLIVLSFSGYRAIQPLIVTHSAYYAQLDSRKLFLANTSEAVLPGGFFTLFGSVRTVGFIFY